MKQELCSVEWKVDIIDNIFSISERNHDYGWISELHGSMGNVSRDDLSYNSSDTARDWVKLIHCISKYCAPCGLCGLTVLQKPFAKRQKHYIWVIRIVRKYGGKTDPEEVVESLKGGRGWGGGGGEK